ncbi:MULTISPECIES: hypothetical protein [Citrobacter]|uniref:hypothetical protein n=1 Tax=Citrobacter TaxID=544 RepID=UPI0011EE02AF|nr:hypothetical protein [Citrobacter braakii]
MRTFFYPPVSWSAETGGDDQMPPENRHHLSEVFTGNISDEHRGMLTGLLNEVILAHSWSRCCR